MDRSTLIKFMRDTAAALEGLPADSDRYDGIREEIECVLRSDSDERIKAATIVALCAGFTRGVVQALCDAAGGN